MSERVERWLDVRGIAHRVWEKGEGEPLGVLAGLGGLPRWSPFLDRLAQTRRVVVPSLPGFPGALGHDRLDTLTDWIAATLDVLEAAELRGADLCGISIGGTLLVDSASLSPGLARRLVLMAPFGLYLDTEPVADPWALPPGTLSHLAHDRAALAARFATPDGRDPVEAQIEQARASEAAARILWPTTDTGLASRLHRVRIPTLVVWGEDDRLLPASYAKELTSRLGGPSDLVTVPDAGHLVEVDAPAACASAIERFLS